MLERARFLSNQDRELIGVRRLVQVPAPGAGLDWSVRVPSGVMWRVLGGQATLTTGVAVANRVPLLVVTASGAVVWVGFCGATFPASDVISVVYTQSNGNVVGTAASTFAATPVGLMWLAQGDTIASSTPALQAADTYTAISLLVEECFFTNEELSEMAEERYELMMAGRG